MGNHRLLDVVALSGETLVSLSEWPLDELAPALSLHSVTASIASVAGRKAMRVALRDEIARSGRPNVDYIDMRTFAMLPTLLSNGTISVDVLGRLLPDAPDYARAFAGLAYRITPATFEAVYLRPCNGLKTQPPPPRHARAIQYFAFPDWRYERLRLEHPDGAYEGAANIAPEEWIHLSVEVQGRHLCAQVDGRTVLEAAHTKLDPVEGPVGLFVDIGTEAYFSNLRVDAR